MHLTFSPTLGHSTTLTILPVTSCNTTHLEVVQFQATFDSKDSFLVAQSDGVKVEVWTDLPVQGHPCGEWAAFQFVELEKAAEDSFSLDGEPSSQDYVLNLQLPTLHTPHSQSRYSFTYRLTYPSGHIEWLGTQDNNGEIIVERGIFGISLAQAWHVREDGKIVLHSSSMGKSKFAHLRKPDSWCLWMLNPLGLPERFTGSRSCEGRVVLLIPHTTTSTGGQVPKPLIMVASDSSSLRVSSEGDFFASSKLLGQVTIGVLESPQDPLFRDAVALNNGAILPHENTVAIAFRQSNAIHPCKILVFPLKTFYAMHTVIPIRLLYSSITEASGSEDMILFSPRLHRAIMVPSEHMERAGVLTCGPSGDEIVVSPLYRISCDGRAWRIGLLSPYKRSSIQLGRDMSSHLPTPPPSPPLGENAGTVPGLVPPNPDLLSSAHHRSHRQTPPLPLARNLPTRLLRAYLHTVFNIILWFWNIFFKALIVRLVGKRVTQRMSAIVGLALLKAGMRPAGGPPLDLQRRTHVSSPDRDIQSVANDHDSGQIRAEGDSVDIVEYDPTGRRLVSLTSRHPRDSPVIIQVPFIPRIVLSADLLNGTATAFIVVQGDGPVKGLYVTLDEERLPLPSMHPLNDDIYLIEINHVSGGGHLEVSYDF